MSGFVVGYERRFWQGSPDHRGSPERPGRVATLVPVAEGRCHGVAYELSSEHASAVLADLDVRECGGYERVELDFMPNDRARPKLRALAYFAAAGNAHYLGDAPIEQMVTQIAAASGPSGHNVEYVLRLAEALDALGSFDAHVFELANLLSDPDCAIE